MLQGALNRNNNQKLINSFSYFSHKHPIFGILAIVYYFILSVSSIPARLLLRKNMGERTFTIPSFLLAFLFFSVFNLILFIVFVKRTSFGLYEKCQNIDILNFSILPNSYFLPSILLLLLNPLIIFMTVIFSKAVDHFKYHLARARINVVSYSFYRGDGIYFEHRKGDRIFGLEINDTLLRMLVEPFGMLKLSVLILALSIAAFLFRSYHPEEGFLFLLIDDITFGMLAAGITSIISSIALFLEEFSIMQKGRDAILDMIDGELDMQRILMIKEKLKIEHPKGLNETEIDNNLLN